MDVMFYTAIVILCLIILSGTGYLVHYYIRSRKRRNKNEDGNEK